MAESDIAAALAFFESCNDLPFLLNLLRQIQPRAAAEVRRLERQRRLPPHPAEIAAAAVVATRDEAVRTVANTRDFAQMQALARGIGRRVEALQPHGTP